MEIRLQKYIADCGILSRRKAEAAIAMGLVNVNGEKTTQMGVKIDPEKDTVLYNGKPVRTRQKNNMVYIMLHKPEGYITTTEDQFDRPTVLSLLDIKERVYPVGRLDYNTSGLLLLTNDGDLAYKLTHPKHQIPKTYLATLDGIPSNTALNQFRKGLVIEDRKTSPASIDILDQKTNKCKVRIVIHEGRNRQVRKMCEAIHHPVIHLKRVATGKLSLDDLPKGQYRHLTPKEVKYLKSL